MGKYKKILFLVLFCATAYAAVQITFNVPTDYATGKMLPAFEAQDGATVVITIERYGESPPAEYYVNTRFQLPARVAGDSDIVYGKKRIATIIDAFVQAHDRKLKEDAQKTYYENAPSVDVNEPDPNNLG